MLFDEEGDSLVLFNSLSCPFAGAVSLPSAWAERGAVGDDGIRLPIQRDDSGLLALVEIPSLSFVTLKKGGEAVDAPADAGSELVLENDSIRYEFESDGRLRRAFDKDAERELVPDGEYGNVLSLYEDRPLSWDAWDIDSYYESHLMETARTVDSGALPGGAVRRGLRFQTAVGVSEIVQKVYLAEGSKRLDFVTQVEWREEHRMLRTAFPVDINADNATFDIQYGFVRRNTHRNTTWDMAKFEVAAHRYVDLSERGYGVALLNDCKYGHKVHNNVLDLNLLRSPTDPDPDADRGHHEFTYSLLPHTGDLVGSDVICEAARLNQRPLVFDGFTAGGLELPCRIEGNGLSLEVLKKAEKEDDLVIRIVEQHGCRTRGRLTVASGATLVDTNLMEWTDGEQVSIEDGIDIELKPFEIRTYKLRA